MTREANDGRRTAEPAAGPRRVLNAIHLPLRFALELAALAILGWWGSAADAPLPARVLLALLLPAAAAAVWGIFRVPNDPGPAVVAIPGPARLALEAALFAAATAALVQLRGMPAAGVFLALAVGDYALSWGRVMRLLGMG
ncbi:MAG: DUF2568 domain-containing protein [Dehalococcoidia bacterium]|nr:DUF2568 domain-containing protein [Dehalococcoidia bacterium]